MRMLFAFRVIEKSTHFVMMFSLACVCATETAAVKSAPLGVFVQRADEASANFMEWESVDTVRRALNSLDRKEGGVIRFSPGAYELEQAIQIMNRDNVSVIGSPGVELVFPAESGGLKTIVSTAITAGDESFLVEAPDSLQEGYEYQLYAPDFRGGRRLEFKVREIVGNRIWLTRPAHLVGKIASLDAGAKVVLQLNFFELRQANNIRIEGFLMNGAGIGAVLGHTIYGGVLAENSFLRASEAGKPLYSGLVVQNNQFRNLKGRGVAVYATDAVLISGNRFERGRAECVEVDHHASAKVLENHFSRCGVAIQLDDAFKTIVSRNVIKNSRRGIVLLGHFDDSWVNTGNIISENELSGCAPIGIMVGAQVSGNTVSGNQMRDCPKQIVDEAPGRNQILGSVPQEN